MNIVDLGFHMLVHVTLTNGLIGLNVCRYNDTHVRCCRNYEEKNNECVECRPGFFGINCLQTCKENFYGILCESKCNCTETQICHHVCGCQPVSSLINDSLTTENETSSYFAETCPTSTTVVFTATINGTQPKQGTLPNVFDFESGSNTEENIGAASVMSVCFLIGIWILYRLHLQNKKEELHSHHNVVYDLEEPPKIQENPNDNEEAAEHLYGTCSYDDTCYSTLTLRVEVLGPCTSKQEVFNDDNVYELAYSFERQNDEEHTPHAFISNMSEAT